MADGPIFDISRTIDESTAVFPGDTKFERRLVMTQAAGCSCNVSTVTFSLHCGTHADAPWHFQSEAATIDAVPLSKFIGACRVVHVRSPQRVEMADLKGIKLEREERLLFRTPVRIPDDSWRDDFHHLSPDVARACAEARLKLVGIDTQSVDPSTSKTLEAHHLLLSGSVAIIENLDLSQIAEGRYELIALPLKIRGADSGPVRAVLRPLPPA